MNFDFDLNLIIPYKITKYNSDLRIIHPINISEDEMASQLNRDMISKLSYIIDKMGEASSKAQGLKEVITSNRKLMYNDSHRIYLMKEPNANGGKGSVVGMLKVGEKKLFVYDIQGKNHEMMPLCVLDFFVCENQQRRGYGKCLFDCMLSMENVESAGHLAIDSPSEKSVRFLKKHYNLINPIPQRNNFVVFNEIFESRRMNNNNRRMNNHDSYSANAAAGYYKNDLPSINNLQNKSLVRTGSFDSRHLNYSNGMNALYNNRNNSLSNMNPSIQMNTNLNTVNQSPTITHHFHTQSTMNRTQPHSAQPLIHTDINSKQYFTNPMTSFLNDPSKSNMTKNNSNSNQNNELSHNQNMINNFYQKTFFNQNHKYNPFPTLGANYEKNTFINASTRPPMPPTANNLMRKETFITNANAHISSSSSSPSLITANLPVEAATAKLFIRDNTGLGLPMSLSNIHKTSPDLISNQSYMSSKFRKTKLW